MPPTAAPAEFRFQDLLDPRRIVRWVYVGRLSLAVAIFLAAVLAWLRASSTNTLIASLSFAAAMVFTVASALYSEIWKRRLGRTFLYLQCVFDLALVTAVVHVTGGPASTFAGIYVLVIAVAALVLPIGGGLLIALLGNVLYFADAIIVVDLLEERGVWLQLAVFAIVALGSALIATRLRRAGSGTQELAAELVKARLEAADILRNIESGILTVDATGHLLYANPAASRLLSLSLDDVTGKPVLGIIAERAPVLAGALERTARDAVRVSRAEGSIAHGALGFPIGVTTTFAEGQDRDGRFNATAIFQDISDQKRMELLQFRTQRLEAVTAVGASLAHEIKNPLAVIRSAVEQLARRVPDNDDERTLAGLIVRETDRVSRILTEFLDFTRIRATRFREVDAGAVARGAATLAASHPDRAPGVTVEIDVPATPVLVDADEDLLHRAIFNLALNGVQAFADGKVVVSVAAIAAAQLPAGAPLRRDSVLIRVTDNGPGIPLQFRDRIFEPFVTTKANGSGLGLPLVHRAVEAHRGLVLVDSDATGTRFSVYLPVAQPDRGETK